MKETLEVSLKKLRLSGLASTLDVRLQEAKANRLNHAEFLELALQDELAVRKERRIARRTKAAAFREQRSLKDFDWSFNTSIKKKQIYDLATCKFIREAPYLARSRYLRKLHYWLREARRSALPNGLDGATPSCYIVSAHVDNCR